MFKVGDIVELSKDCTWYDCGIANPKNTKGVITKIMGHDNIEVSWSNGELNYYARCDLIPLGHATEQQPKPYTGGVPEVGMEVVLHYNHDSKSVTCQGEVLYACEKHCILRVGDAVVYKLIGDWVYESLPTKEDMVEKGLFDILKDNLYTGYNGQVDTSIFYEVVHEIIEKFDINLKEK